METALTLGCMKYEAYMTQELSATRTLIDMWTGGRNRYGFRQLLGTALHAGLSLIKYGAARGDFPKELRSRTPCGCGTMTTRRGIGHGRQPMTCRLTILRTLWPW